MSWRRLLHLIGAVVAAVGVAMLAAAVTSIVYREWDHALGITAAAVVTILLGGTAWRLVEAPGELSTREGFATVGLSWLAVTFFGTLPYLLTGSIPDLTDAFFETAAGFSTTGASVVADPAELAHGILLWRSLTQWLGGMGIIVLSVAILPLLGVGGVELARAESPGPIPDRLTPRFRETAKRLWLLYVAFTALEAILLGLGEMSIFEAIAHSLTTMSTGGFGTHVGSLGAYSSYSQWVVIVFMIIAGASFALHYRGLRRPRAYFDSAEFRLYGMIILASAVAATIGIWDSADPAGSVRDGLFNTTSIITTTGFATADFGAWVPALQILILGLMFVGGMAGSTGGAVKPYRLGVLYQASRTDLRRVIHPRGVFRTRFGGEIVPDRIVANVQAFFLLYMFIFMTATLIMGVIESGLGVGLDLVTSASAVASSLGNIGPGLGLVGPSFNYEIVHDGAKWLLSLLMIIGRLEIFPVLLLLTPEIWRR